MSDAILTSPAQGRLQMTYGGASFEATDDGAVIGALLFALGPRGVRYESDTPEGAQALEASLNAAMSAALVLHAHPRRENRNSANLPAFIPLAAAQRWVSSALELCPTEVREAVDKRMTLRLGPRPWCEGVH